MDNGWELACIRDEEVERFSKRTIQIEAEAKRDHKKLWASARWLAEKTGMDVADAYAMEKAKLGGRTREKKSQAVAYQRRTAGGLAPANGNPTLGQP